MTHFQKVLVLLIAIGLAIAAYAAALLGHADGSITSHYSAAELAKLIEYANKVSTTDTRSPALTVLKRRSA